MGSTGPVEDLATIWKDFMKIFVHRSDNADSNKQELFVCYTPTNFDLIYSKWGTTPGWLPMMQAASRSLILSISKRNRSEQNYLHWASGCAVALHEPD
jgi:hypothetical protein